jgi:hypothetical protein
VGRHERRDLLDPARTKADVSWLVPAKSLHGLSSRLATAAAHATSMNTFMLCS